MEWLQGLSSLKTIDGVRKRTVGGAISTIVACTLITILCFSELMVFLKVRTVHHMTVDTTIGEEASATMVPIHLDATFPHLHCEDVQIQVEATRGDLRDVEDRLAKEKVDGGAGCRVFGDLVVGKVGGNFHIGTGALSMKGNLPLIQLSSGGLLPGMLGGSHGGGANISHTIHHLSFGPDFPGAKDPLKGVVNVVPTDVGQYQFHMSAIPTLYRRLGRRPIQTFQYTVTEQFVKLDLLSALRSTNPPGIYFYYDFYPVMVEYAETKTTLLQFLTRIFGIIGGVYTVSSLLDGFLHHSYEQIKKIA